MDDLVKRADKALKDRADAAEARVKVLEDALWLIDQAIDARSELFTSGSNLPLNIQGYIRAVLKGEK